MNIQANVEALFPKYKSKAEEAWADDGYFIIAQEFRSRGQVMEELYEPLTFHLPGGSYTPDFVYIMHDRSVVIVEVKGSKKQKNYRDARTKLRAAAALFSWLGTWVEAVGGAAGFELEVIND